jgi:hypothetical protein
MGRVGGVDVDAAAFVDDLADSGYGDLEFQGEAGDRDAQMRDGPPTSRIAWRTPL